MGRNTRTESSKKGRQRTGNVSCAWRHLNVFKGLKRQARVGRSSPTGRPLLEKINEDAQKGSDQKAKQSGQIGDVMGRKGHLRSSCMGLGTAANRAEYTG